MAEAPNTAKIDKLEAKRKTKKAERQSVRAEGHRRDFTNEIEENNAASGGHPDEPIPTTPNSRSAKADLKRAAAKAGGVMSSLSKKNDPDLKLSTARDTGAKAPGASDGTKRSAGARSADKALDKGSVKTGADGAPARRTKSNAEIADGVTTTAKKSPAPRAARADAAAEGTAGEPARANKRTGGARQRMPAPGNVVTAPKGKLAANNAAEGEPGERSTASTGGAKPPKKSARAGKSTGASKSKGADIGLES